ncbi:MAG: hypothetical protein FK734_06955 [Asgard group archaeon]|nr:hypothetical protein [Asgard group archaeon]
MKNRTKILITICATMTLLLLTNVNFIQAADISWEVGDNYYYGYRLDIWDSMYYVEDDIEYYQGINEEGLEFLNITSIDNVTQIIYYDVVSAGSITHDNTLYSADFIVNNYFDLDTMFLVDYTWNYEDNSTKLNSFSFGLSFDYFIEANWSLINSGIVNAFNTSGIIDTVADPYIAVIYNITLGEMLNNISFSINGVKDDLTAGLATLTSTNRQFHFTFDCSDVLEVGVYNSTAGYDNNYPIKTYIVGYDADYTIDGRLDYIKTLTHYRYELDDFQEEFYQLIAYQLGGIPTETNNFAYLTIVPSIATIVIIIKIKQKRR